VLLIGLAVNKIPSFYSISKQSAFEMEVAVMEAVNNAVEYAHHHNREKVAKVRVRIPPDHIRFIVVDSGEPFDFKAAIAASVGLKNAHKVELGRGFSTIRALVDQVKYERKGETNQITLVKY